MSLNYDCYYEIAAYLKDEDYINFCQIFNIKMQIQNFTIPYIEEELMKLYELDLDLSTVIGHHVRLGSWYKLSEGFIRKYKDCIDWSQISREQELSEDFIIEFKDVVDWFYISLCQTLSEEFIEKFKDRVNWDAISCKQELSETFIRKFQDYVNWRSISINQKLSEGFIKEFRDSVKWFYIPYCQNVSTDFIVEFKDRIACWYEFARQARFFTPSWQKHIADTFM